MVELPPVRLLALVIVPTTEALRFGIVTTPLPKVTGLLVVVLIDSVPLALVPSIRGLVPERLIVLPVIVVVPVNVGLFKVPLSVISFELLEIFLLTES